MAETKSKKISPLDKLSYQELEERGEEILRKIQDDNLPLDEVAKLYQEGLEITKRMEEMLKVLSSQVKDEVKE